MILLSPFSTTCTLLEQISDGDFIFVLSFALVNFSRNNGLF